MDKTLLISLDEDDLSINGISFLTKVAGLSIIKRLILTFQLAGGRHIIFILPKGCFNILKSELADDRIKLSLSLFDINSVTEVLDLVDGDVLFLSTEAIFDRGLLVDLLKTNINRGIYSIFIKPALPDLQGNKNIINTDFFLISGDILKDYDRDDLSKDSVQEWILNSSFLSKIELDKRFYLSIKSKDDIRFAQRGLLKFLRKPSDPFISRTFNRPISLFITRFLMHTSITPNMVTMLTLLISFISIYFIFQEGYIYGILGAFFLHTASVIDGCDGEIARLKYQFSDHGELLDSLVDDFKNGIFIFGMGIRSYFESSDNSVLADLYLYGAIAHAISFLTAKFLQYKALLSTDKRDILDYTYFFEDDSHNNMSFTNRALLFFRNFARSDFLGFSALIMAIFGLLSVLFMLAVPLMIGMGIVVIIQTIINKRGLKVD